MAKISLICEQCGGNIILDDSHEIGTCEHCFAQFVVKQDHIVKNITQNITKYVYGYEGKDVEELLNDGYQLKQLCDDRKANAKFKRAIDLEPNCWSAWLGYASTGGDRSGYLSVVPAYVQAYNVAADEQQETETFVDMTRYLPDSDLRAAERSILLPMQTVTRFLNWCPVCLAATNPRSHRWLWICARRTGALGLQWPSSEKFVQNGPRCRADFSQNPNCRMLLQKC